MSDEAQECRISPGLGGAWWISDFEPASANPQDAAKALRSIKIAEKICAEGNSFEAAKKFALARTQIASNVQFAERR